MISNWNLSGAKLMINILSVWSWNHRMVWVRGELKLISSHPSAKGPHQAAHVQKCFNEILFIYKIPLHPGRNRGFLCGAEVGEWVQTSFGHPGAPSCEICCCWRVLGQWQYECLLPGDSFSSHFLVIPLQNIYVRKFYQATPSFGHLRMEIQRSGI